MSNGYGAGLQLFGSAASAYSNAYIGQLQVDAQREISKYKKKTQSVLTSISVTAAINSAEKVRSETVAMAKRKELEIQRQAVAGLGAATVEAAAAGAQGKRVQLAREQQITGEADRQLGYLQKDLSRQLGAITDQEIAAYKQAVMGILAEPTDVIMDYDITGDILDFATDAYSIYSSYTQREAEADEEAGQL